MVRKRVEKRLSKRELKEKEKIRESLDISVREGAATSVMTGAGNSFITPFALAIGAGNIHIGFLSSFVGLVGPLTQLFNSRLIEKYSRKKIVLFGVLLQALMWLPVILIGAMFYFNVLVDFLPWLLIVSYSFYIAFGAITNPPWFSWMGDLVSEDYRGNYFGRRNQVTGIVMIITMLVGGFFLDYFRTKGIVLFGFAVLFSVSMFARFYSLFLLNKQYCPKFKLPKDYYFSFNDFIARAVETNFGKFVFFMGFFYLAASIASPFFSVYLLKELNLNYVWFTIVTLSGSVFSVFVMPFWGKFSSKYGNRITFFLSSIFISFTPLLWLLSPSKFYLIFVPQLVGGVAWAGFNLSAFNFVYDSVTPPKRALGSIYNHVFIGIGLFVGPLIGGFLLKFYPVVLLGSSFFYLFAISSAARMLVSLFFVRKIKEVRSVAVPRLLIHEVRFMGLMENGLHRVRHVMSHTSNLPDVRFQKDFERVEKIFVD